MSLLAQCLPTPELERSRQLYTLLAATTAAGDLDGLAEVWSALPTDAHRGGLEAVLQTHLFAGFPRTINALARLQALGVDADAYGVAAVPPEQWKARGEALCAAIYGSGYPRLREKMLALHPQLDAWMIELGYGRVLSREGLSAADRELCAVIVLAGQNVPPQLESHLRGALRLGVTAATVAACLQPVPIIFGDRAHASAQRVWQRLQATAP